jgi:hypothetical protein
MGGEKEFSEQCLLRNCTISRDVIPCNMAEVYQHLEECNTSIFILKTTPSKNAQLLLQNIGKHLSWHPIAEYSTLQYYY